VAILERALRDPERGLGATGATADTDSLRLIARLSGGDARGALNILELAVTLHGGAVTEGAIRDAVQKKTLLYDKSGEEHYNLISALHKSLRDSDPDGALYWLGRMLEAGEDALYIARRLVRFASEDVGNADPQALRVTLDAKESDYLGSPEETWRWPRAATWRSRRSPTRARRVESGQAGSGRSRRARAAPFRNADRAHG
jgi:putative ATPase